jgi:hypothetical protein
MNPTILYQFERAAFLVGVVAAGGAFGAAIPPAIRGLDWIARKWSDHDIAKARAKRDRANNTTPIQG